MVIDFHTHVYPDKIAARTIAMLKKSAKDVYAHTDGTLQGLLDSMRSAGIDRSVILPVATKAGQFDTINKFAKAVNDTYDNLISFGGIHPDDEDTAGKLLYLKEQGFKGIKIHPDYTGTFIDDERYIKIITECARLGLLVITHSGVDPAFDIIHCPPEKGRAVLDKAVKDAAADKPFMIFAHLGGMMMSDEVRKHLVGANCYIDISCAFPSLLSFCNNTDDDVVQIIKAHGAEKILFATDCPWTDQKASLEHFRSLKGLSDNEKELILHKNAERLLAITDEKTE